MYESSQVQHLQAIRPSQFDRSCAAHFGVRAREVKCKLATPTSRPFDHNEASHGVLSMESSVLESSGSYLSTMSDDCEQDNRVRCHNTGLMTCMSIRRVVRYLICTDEEEEG
jgi:hypothetical protein